MQRVELNDDILLGVARPARYIGEERNAIKKPWDKAIIKVCLCYPDLYEVGMSHLGLKVLYHILNERKDTLCERSFAPWPDMEAVMRKRAMPLFSLESKMPLASFDILGFSLQYELTYTNLLCMLELAGIPLKTSDRTGPSSDRDNGRFPLIIAGGPSAFNPEPLAEFIDLFLIGDGEEGIIDIIEAYKKSGAGERKALLEEMANIEGVYVPSLYNVSYDGDRIRSIEPAQAGVPKRINKRTVKRLEKESFPTAPIVPFISTIHDRIILEIMRGCPHGCRFCQAKNIYSPVRLRESGELIDLAEQTYKKTGLDEISLVSLSTSSYPYIDELIDGLTARFTPLGVNISLPSLRVEEDLKRLPLLISAVKKSGLTFAPEAGTEKMQRIINKNISYKELFEAIRQAYRMGWRRLKLYFMIGLPFEEESDLEAIIGVCEEAAMLKRAVSRGIAEVTVNVSSFIPKPHTPFQWFGMAKTDELSMKQQFLRRKAAGKRYLRLKLHDLQTSVLEAVFSRGDRRLAAVLLDAYRNGARFDAWTESFNPRIWEQAFEINKIDKDRYLGDRGYDEVLPWGHISCGVEAGALMAEHSKAAASAQKLPD